MTADEHGVFDLSDGVDLSAPNVARMYDYYLGGAANFAIDRDTADEVLAITPEAGRAARANRDFLGRTVAYLCEQGVDQFLDLGSGIPTVGNVHEIAHRHNPEARVLYVDHDAVAVLHARSLLGAEPRAEITRADIRDPGAVLSSPEVAELLDFSRPVAVLAVAVLHFLPDADRPAEVLRAYTDRCAPGSYLAISHVAGVGMTDAQVARGRELYNTTPTPVIVRDRDEIAGLVEAYSLVEPGLVPINHWPVVTPEAPAGGYGAVARSG
ncbi:hypothetical protein EIL87_02270 [Saccharopolyspora rhizosphaerae]|uniref:SAM-dependent methyltransferase n=1 Tax=Saccharopolyspora rhizosphaerae TaxID=2492662 RepID=A0A3R8P6N7_9PSEU|nr:SAM-dependent methyltransferase [Saccharopolyspora rhizosphaerae]RRO20706.1 hypothetical protein EIL87_02270 [Saccharopolyspora rhizosphaerae]